MRAGQDMRLACLATALLFASFVSACDRSAQQASRSEPAAPKGAGPSAGESIYGLDLTFTDQEGRALKLSDLRGSILVAAMMYSSCQSVCPRVTEDMKGIEGQLGADTSRVRFVLFSLDPGRDTPAALREFAHEHGLHLARWRLMATSEDGVRELASVLGVKYRNEEGGEIAHSAMIFLIDREGVVRHRQVGLGESPGELLAALKSVG